jgi:hypothetical protein
MILLFAVGIVIGGLSVALTFLICGKPHEECVAAIMIGDRNAFIFKWLGIYYAEVWFGCTRIHTTISLSKDAAIEKVRATANAWNIMFSDDFP